jgi:hypothetical protein
MEIFFTDQAINYVQHLQRLCKASVMAYNIEDLQEKQTHINIATSKKFEDLDLRFLFDYKIFPAYILDYLTQWSYENRSIKVGDTIVQQALIPPNKIFSTKIIFGVRIKEIVLEQNRIGYSYETLEGHVEKGISTFTVEKVNGDEVIFKIHTYSAPGNWLTKLVGPVFSVPYQTYCTRKALQNVKRYLELQK